MNRSTTLTASAVLRFSAIGLSAIGLFAIALQQAHAQSTPHDEMPGMQMNQPQNPPTPPPTPPPASPLAAPDKSHPLPPPDLLADVVRRTPMGLAEFLAFADHENPTLAQARDLSQRSAQQARQAALYPNPSVGYQGEQIRGGSFGGGEQGGFIQQTIVLGGKLGLRRDIFAQQEHADRIGEEEQALRVHNDVTQAFYIALTAQATVVVRQRLLQVATDAVETVHQLANVGQADAPDLLQAEVEAQKAKVDFVTAQRQFLVSFRTLAALSGRPDLPASPLSGSLEALPEIDAEKQAQKVAAESPAVVHAEREMAVAEARVRDAKRERVPDLDLRAGEQYNGERLTEFPVRKAVGAQTFATAGIDIPLWNRNQGAIGAAQADLERAQREVTRTRLSVKQQAEFLKTSYLSARYTADQYRTELIPSAWRAYELTLTKYQSMAQAYPQVLVSQRTLFDLQIGYVLALQESWTSAVALEHFALTGGLAAPAPDASSASGGIE